MNGLHVGVIMDGNGRWAEARGLPRLSGHREGAEALRRLVEAAPQEGASAKKLLERMKSANRLDTFKADLAHRKALDLLTESAKPTAKTTESTR